MNGTSGTSGTTGTSGTSGSTGTSGTSGVNGTNGTSGTSGSSGTTGTSGSSGINGSSGTSGTTGTSGINGTSGSSGSSGSSGTTGTSGSTGTSGTSGAQGNKGGLLYTFSTATSGVTSSGFFRFNNATIGSVTSVVINNVTTDGANVVSYLSAIGNALSTPQGYIIIESNTNSDSTYAIFSFSSVSTTSEVAYTVTYVSGTLPSNNEVCVISFNRTGNPGTSGTTGTSGTSGTRGTSGTSGVSPTVSGLDNQVLTSDGSGGIVAEANCIFNAPVNSFVAGVVVAPINYEVYDGVTSVLSDLQSWGSNSSFVATGEILAYEYSNAALSKGQIIYRSLYGGKWDVARWDAANEAAVNMLGVCLTNTTGDNEPIEVLIRGFVSTTFTSNLSSSEGCPLYLGAAGICTDVPTTTTGKVVRLIGYTYWNTGSQNNGLYIIRFDPDNTWIEL